MAKAKIRNHVRRLREERGITQADLDAIAVELNDRPRRTLGYQAPSQALAQVLR